VDPNTDDQVSDWWYVPNWSALAVHVEVPARP